MTDSGFHVYFWRLLIFRWTLYKADISIKRTLLSCTNGVHFIEIPLWFLKRHVLINLFSVNFTSIETEWERGSSSQNERTLRGGGVVENEQGWTRGHRRSKSGILSELTFWMSPINSHSGILVFQTQLLAKWGNHPFDVNVSVNDALIRLFLRTMFGQYFKQILDFSWR